MLIFLLLGAILNVAVAWGNALLVDVYQGPRESALVVFDYPVWNVNRLTRWGAVRVFSYRTIAVVDIARKFPHPREIIPEWGDLDIPIAHFGGEDGEAYESSRTIDGRGWPWISLWSEVCRETKKIITGSMSISVSKPLGGIDSKLPPLPYPFSANKEHYLRVLPCRPIWPGFIFNTLFYATPLWLLFPGRYMLRRHRRIRRGRCGQCGYLVAPNIGIPGASPHCPECGTPNPNSSGG